MTMNVALASADQNCISVLRAFLAERYPDSRLSVAADESGAEACAVMLADVTMPGGFACAEAAQRVNPGCITVLIGDEASIVQYAAQGYELGAVAFLKKPLTSLALSMKLPPVFQLAERTPAKQILLEHRQGIVRLRESEIVYVELQRHKLIYHTHQGSFTVNGSMRQALHILSARFFAQRNSCYLVNLQYVDREEKDTVRIGGETMQMSREGRKTLLRAMMDYHGGGDGR